MSTPGRFARLDSRRSRCNHRHGIWLRHDDQGLWLHAAPGSRLCGEVCAHFCTGQGRDGISGCSQPAGAVAKAGLAVAYHSACSMQHGQKITHQPKELLAKAGFVVREPREGHLCCGSAGTYNIMQPEIATQLRDRKVRNIAATGAESRRHRQYRLHGRRSPTAPACRSFTPSTLLDWAYGGAKAEGALSGLLRQSVVPAAAKKKGSAAIAARCPTLAAVQSDPLRCSGRPSRFYMTMTCVPTFTRSYRSTTSSFSMRMQPEETAPSSRARWCRGCGKASQPRYMARAPSGFPGRRPYRAAGNDPAASRPIISEGGESVRPLGLRGDLVVSSIPAGPLPTPTP